MKTIILSSNHVLMQKSDETFIIPEESTVSAYINIKETMSFDAYDSNDYSFIEVSEEFYIDENFDFFHFSQLWDMLDQQTLGVLGRAMQLNFWNMTSKFCGRCGEKFWMKEHELGKECICGNMSYPAAYPAVIVMVHKGDEVLLVKTKYQPYSFYSCIAGFVDPGERLEAAVEREVMEEVGIKIENITYFDSLPVAPSNNIMIGFIATYKSGEVTPAENEIAEAAWYHIDNLPEIPPKFSLPARMIETLR